MRINRAARLSLQESGERPRAGALAAIRFRLIGRSNAIAAFSGYFGNHSNLNDHFSRFLERTYQAVKHGCGAR
jgi:hypothetical protein